MPSENKNSTSLVQVDELKSGIAKFTDRKNELIKLAEESKKLKVNGLEDKEGLKNVSEMRKRLKASRISISKEGKDLRDVITPISRHISAKEKELISIIESEEVRLQGEEDRIEEEKEAIRKEKQRERDEKIQRRVNIVLSLGMAFNGIDYSFGELKITHLEIANHDEDSFTNFLIKLKEESNKAAEEKARKEKIQILQEQRESLLIKYGLNGVAESLGEMPDDKWNQMINDIKSRYEKTEAEKRAEQKAKEERFKKRDKELIDLGFTRFDHKYVKDELFVLTNSLNDFIDEEWNDLMKQIGDAIARNKELSKLREEQEEVRKRGIELHNEKVKQRCNQLSEMGLVFNGSEYVFRDVNVHGNEIGQYSEEQWAKLIAKISPEISRIKEQEKQEEIEKIALQERIKIRKGQIEYLGMKQIHEGGPYVHPDFVNDVQFPLALLAEDEKNYSAALEELNKNIKKFEIEATAKANALLSEKEQLTKWLSSIKIEYHLDETIVTENGKELYADIVRNFDRFIDGSKKMINQLK